MSIIKDTELKYLRESCSIVREALDAMIEFIKPGASTADIDRIGRRIIESRGAIPSFLGYHDFPASVCVSINREVVHGIPSAIRIIQEGDLVGIDVGAYKNGFHGDAAETVAVGKISPVAAELLETVYIARRKGIDAARAGNRIGDIGYAIQQYVEGKGFSVVKTLVGHGIGRDIHEPPQVPNYGISGKGYRLKEGLALAIEPMINEGGSSVSVLKDAWTIVTDDGSLSAHAEHTIMVTGDEPLILTA